MDYAFAREEDAYHGRRPAPRVPRREDRTMSRRKLRASVALAVMAAGGLAGPAAGQSSAWHNPDPERAATIRIIDGTTEWLAVECVHGDPWVVFAVAGAMTDSIFDSNGPEVNRVHFAFRFDGRRDTEIVLPAVAGIQRAGMRIEVSDAAALLDGPDALIPLLRRASYAETGRAGTNRWRPWSLVRAAAAIDRLPCYGGDR